MRPHRLPLAGRALAVAALAGGSAADSQTFTFQVPLQSTAWNTVAPLPRFQPALGELLGLEVSFATFIGGTVRFENRDPVPATIVTDFSAAMALRRPDTNAILSSVDPTFHIEETVGAFDGIIDFAGDSGRTFDNLTASQTGFFQPALPLSPADHALFVGNGNILFTVSAQGTSSASGAGNLLVNFQQQASAVISITYTFEPPFFPDCNQNGLIDSLDVSSGSSPDCNQNGLPDECELVGNDCNDNGRPDDCDFANGVLTDADGDGVPDECSSCLMIERHKPASLLVYPEFDNRPGSTTLLSITNVQCGPRSSPIQVEFVYIDHTNCLETNRTVVLTPCDTTSFLTQAHIGGSARGYVYAFARTARGAPITHNHLIGSEIVLDALDSLDYSVSPFLFRGIPQPDGALTDLDADGLRDLDGREYEPAPDVILIPRFLGQLTGNLIGSQLILIGLTGGGAFETTVAFQVFNDNEEALLAQHTFQCWAKPNLLAINGVFRESVLQDTNHDPNEVPGLGRETGWMRIDGFLAQSPLTEFIDPAFLAVLVERREGLASADLPWEWCSQTNGDLLPLGQLGDTSP